MSGNKEFMFEELRRLWFLLEGSNPESWYSYEMLERSLTEKIKVKRDRRYDRDRYRCKSIVYEEAGFQAPEPELPVPPYKFRQFLKSANTELSI